MVRERKVDTTRVDVKGLAKHIGCHGRALDVPSRSALAPGRRPRRLTGLGAFPKREISTRTLEASLLGGKRAFTVRLELLVVPVPWLQTCVHATILLPVASVVVHRTLMLVGVPVVLNLLDKVDNLRSVLCHTSELARVLHVECLHVVEKSLLIFLRKFRENLVIVALDRAAVQ